jgi:ABC-2 type transport system ATP-binding protein
MSAVSVQNLVKRFGDFTAVSGISFEVAPGQVTALLGRNGAGKTTTIEILEGFQAASSGTVRVLGADPRKGGRAWRARIGLVLQTTALDAQLTVAEALTLYGGLYKNPLKVSDVLESIDLTDDASTKIGALSGGQKRRVDLGIAVIGRPEMLFLDEPTTGLDPEVRRRMWHIVEDLAAQGSTVLLSTHYMDEAQYLASRIIVLADGKVAADTTPARMRAMAGPPVISLPKTTPPHLVSDLQNLLDRWASDHDVDITGLEVSPPSLEDAYLSLTQGDSTNGDNTNGDSTEGNSHV